MLAFNHGNGLKLEAHSEPSGACVEWCARSPGDLGWHQWGEAHFAFDPASGQTHFLNELAAETIKLLSAEKLSAEKLYTRLIQLYAVDEDAALLTSLQTTLAQLDELGLIARA